MKAIIIIVSCFVGLLFSCICLFSKRKKQKNNHKILEVNSIPLSQLLQGQTAFVERIIPQCKGTMRSRLLDLGFVKGSKVSVYLISPMQNPKAYLIRNTIVALRNEQAQYILVKISTNANNL